MSKRIRPKWLPKFIDFEQDSRHKFYSAFKRRIRVTQGIVEREWVVGLGRYHPKGLKLQFSFLKGEDYLIIEWRIMYQKHDEPPF